ncbi:DUF7620 family protein [Actinacidiphila sp. ITFR-21]|uniref:DUF7620 family protein n=1 Tax=Actinacidiphila sp. ITFR-21 TaxID=3075199 RepID=UPI002889B345|nr:hypothetical protein [Streptomyces sp. ITFR-21]WNI15586.1 hypothetical protein RLT57_08625 [Streptomyces sp. ITFR-21]
MRRRGDASGQAAADAALVRAKWAKDEAEKRGPEVSEIAGRLRHLRERNGFAEMIDRALRGGT